ncbi:MAG: leucine--tRNA ligase [Maribacter sp.]|nr:leucine--tRNA ligase [Maribacter sp.]
MQYNFNEIEAKWQKYWAENQTFKAANGSDKPKFYVLDMFPYPSGAGLHVGHPLGYIASDIYARYKRHQGFNVLHPMGYDSFGLPAEQYAIQTGQHPADTTRVNIEGGKDKEGNVIEGYRKQLDRMGFSFDWGREVRTSDPSYYKWTQWIFIKLFNTWYNKVSDKAEDIKTLITTFEAEGNIIVSAICDADVPIFSAKEWRQYTRKRQEEILLKYRLTYLAESEVNWCPALGTVLANDEIVNGVSERGGHPVIRKKMTQWSMRITAYAERLLNGLEKIDWPQPLKDSQANWIGRSVGAIVKFKLLSATKDKISSLEPKPLTPKNFIEVFTTRPDTIFGVSFMTLAPEHDLVPMITTTEQKEEVESYIEATARRSERDRMSDVKTISGAFTGAYVEHPFTKEPVPVWIGDYVLAGYGTGAVMSVPCGDQRDYDFAKHFNIPIPNIFEGVDISLEAFADKDNTIIANSDFLNGLTYKEATGKVIAALEKIGHGEGKVNYRLRDAVFSRQRYWGEPFPVYYDEDGMPRMLDEKFLPLKLPEVKKYLPTETGEPPLGNATVWAWDTNNSAVVGTRLIDHKSVFPLELNTMPGWAGSSQYFNRYMDAHNEKAIFSQEAINYWQDVDLYIGGSEHATGHLLYSRFWQKFMFDLGLVPKDEFAKKLINQGMITGTSAFIYRLGHHPNVFVSKELVDAYQNEETKEDVLRQIQSVVGNTLKDLSFDKIHVDVDFVDASDQLDVIKFRNWQPEFKNAMFIPDRAPKLLREVEKMSKSKYNVVSPDAICTEYGADSLRLYEMFLGPLEQSKPWNTAGITGVHSFLKKLWKLYFDEEGLKDLKAEPSAENLKTLHKTIKKAKEDIENFSFNTSVSTFMICVNELTTQNCQSKSILESLAILVSPYAPHIAEELWEKLGNSTSISTVSYPKFEAKYVLESSKEYPISFNGKLRFTIELPLDMGKDEIEAAVLAHEKTRQQLQGRTPKKVIIVPGKIVNIVS